MITWNLTLSGQQISLLKVFSDRVEGKPHPTIERERQFGVHPNTIPGSRTLCREGLLVHKEVKTANGYCDTLRSGLFITDRGKFILQMVETDIDKFLSAEGQLKQKRQLRRAS